MRTELARVQTEAQKQSFISNGFEMYTFHANHGCCNICGGLDGKHFKVKDMMPGLNAPPVHPNCRCSVSAYEDSDEYERWLDYLASGGTTAEWNKIKYSAVKSKKPLENSAKRSTMEAKNNVVMSAVKSGAVSAIINEDKQGRHIKGHKRYTEGRSYIDGSVEDAQAIVDELLGTGKPIMASNGNWTNKERVEAKREIGTHVDPETGEETKTKKGTIIYSRTGSHIVPRKGEDK